jgi:hypothetical protein
MTLQQAADAYAEASKRAHDAYLDLLPVSAAYNRANDAVRDARLAWETAMKADNPKAKGG